jgi:transposase
MSKVTIFVGLDYHQHSVRVCVLDAQGRELANRDLPDDAERIALFAGRHGAVAGCAIEACCGASELAGELADRHGWPVHLAHPGYVRRMKQNPDKTDHADARLLADLERVGYLPRVWRAPQPIRDLRRLVRYRQGLVDERRNAKLRIRALLRDARLKSPVGVRPWTKLWHAWLENAEGLGEQARWVLGRYLATLDRLAVEIAEVEARLRDVTADDPEVAKLLAQKGVGLVTAVTLRAEIGRFDRFRTGKQLARYCGLSPRNASSGERQADAGLIKAGDAQLRATLIEAAHRLARYDAKWTALATRLKRRGKPTNVAIAAVANRWVRWLYHQMQPSVLAA